MHWCPFAMYHFLQSLAKLQSEATLKDSRCVQKVTQRVQEHCQRWNKLYVYIYIKISIIYVFTLILIQAIGDLYLLLNFGRQLVDKRTPRFLEASSCKLHDAVLPACAYGKKMGRWAVRLILRIFPRHPPPPPLSAASSRAPPFACLISDISRQQAWRPAPPSPLPRERAPLHGGCAYPLWPRPGPMQLRRPSWPARRSPGRVPYPPDTSVNARPQVSINVPLSHMNLAPPVVGAKIRQIEVLAQGSPCGTVPSWQLMPPWPARKRTSTYVCPKQAVTAGGCCDGNRRLWGSEAVDPVRALAHAKARGCGPRRSGCTSTDGPPSSASGYSALRRSFRDLVAESHYTDPPSPSRLPPRRGGTHAQKLVRIKKINIAYF